MKSILSALGDQVRRLSGKTNTMGFEEMTESLASVELGVNTEGLTAASSDVVSGKVFIGANSEQEIGTMVNRGAVDIKLNGVNKEYNVEAGYHNGKGKVRVETQTKTVVPSLSEQWVYPDGEKLLSAVFVGAADPGAQYYTGEFQNSSISTGMTIDTGVSLRETDIFMVMSSTAAALTNTGIAISAIRMAQDDCVTLGVGIGVGMGGSALQMYTNANITYSGSEVRIVFAGSCVTQTKFRWILIRR